MWNVRPDLLCRAHLLGEHQETHSFVGVINKGWSVKGYLEKGLLEIHTLRSRHDELAIEIERRSYRHLSPLPDFPVQIAGRIQTSWNLGVLAERCDACRVRQGLSR